jgi:hypothetical protein
MQPDEVILIRCFDSEREGAAVLGTWCLRRPADPGKPAA